MRTKLAPIGAVALRGFCLAALGCVVWLLLATIAVIGAVTVAFHYQAAGTAALQQDQRLLRLVPMLADSVLVPRDAPSVAGDLAREAPSLTLLMAPPIQEFLADREGHTAVGVFDAQGERLFGADWLPVLLPTTEAPEYVSVVEGGVTQRRRRESITSTAVAATPPKRTVISGTKPLPATRTDVPPVTGPLAGVTPLTAGAGTTPMSRSPASALIRPWPMDSSHPGVSSSGRPTPSSADISSAKRTDETSPATTARWS